MASIVNVLSTWPTPSDQGDVIYGAMGTTTTCTVQGFFNEFGNITTPLYSASLCIWYLLFIKYGWREKECEGIEYVFHVIPIGAGFVMAVIGLVFSLYNNSGFLCWYAPYPAGCDTVEPHTCTRGEYAGAFRWIHYGVVWTAIALVTVSMASICSAVRLQEQITVDRKSAATRHSREIAEQAVLYVCALYLTWVFTTATRISQTAFKFNCYQLLILMATFFPLQGFWNALIYFRRRRQNNRERQRTALPQSFAINAPENISNGDSPDTELEPRTSSTSSTEIWERVRLRQLKRAEVAVEKLEEEKKKKIEEEKEIVERMRIVSYPDLSRQEEDTDNIEILNSGGVERRVVDTIDLSTHSQTLPRHSQRSEHRRSFWKTMELGANSEIWKRVKLRQLERAQAAVEKAELDEIKRIEEEEQQRMMPTADSVLPPQEEDDDASSIDFMDSGEIERRVFDIINKSMDSPSPGILEFHRELTRAALFGRASSLCDNAVASSSGITGGG
eukprot:CAMPEP_0197190996 /NCGR_PEP_ID=MMETSP1423-20130617/22605_1 /TAXON_ID=476441 /ORGANISM="Pseudo-nitzschia heimii, Strain UNC1101" /LENGTH=502 /DNA_ID=CAMNT_0042643505 /DNA_START=351 /DNA_END=1860 /DNA_ORIENTATION=+